MTAKPRSKPSPAPKGRNNPAQGNALGKAIPEDQSPEGARQSCVINLPDLPNNWHYAQVQDVGATDEQAVMTGPFGTNLGRGDFISKGVPLLTISCLTDQGIRMDKALYVSEAKANELGRYRLKQGDLLFSRMASVGRAGIVGPQQEGALFNYHIMRLRLDDAKMLPKFFTSYVRGAKQVYDYLLEVNHGATRDGINTEQLLSMPIILAPISDQRRIVAEIEKQFTRLEAGVAALRRVQANLKRYRASVLKAACEGHLVPTEAELARTEGRPFESGQQLLARILTVRRQNWQGRGQYKEPAAPDTANLSEIPNGWTWATVAQLGDVQLGRQRSPKNISKNYPTKYIRAANITGRGIDVSDVLEMEFSPAERERFALRDGDIILSEASGSPSQVGKPAVWRGELPLCCFQNTVLRLRPAIVGSKYVLVAFQHFYANSVFANVAGGVGINHLGAEKFSAIPFPLPPLAEQTRIVAEVERRLSVVEELEAVVTTNLQRATRLRQSILQKAFAGELFEAGEMPFKT